MTLTAPQTTTDPLHVFMAGAFASASPMPLAATSTAGGQLRSPAIVFSKIGSSP